MTTLFVIVALALHHAVVNGSDEKPTLNFDDEHEPMLRKRGLEVEHFFDYLPPVCRAIDTEQLADKGRRHDCVVSLFVPPHRRN